MQDRDYLQMTDRQLQVVHACKGERKFSAIAALIKAQNFMTRLKSDGAAREAERRGQKPRSMMTPVNLEKETQVWSSLLTSASVFKIK